jgi:hypothetical protein
VNLEDGLRDGQTDIFQRTLADEYLQNVFVVNADKGVIAQDVSEGLTTYSKREGGTKVGAGIIVLPPIVDPDDAEVLGGIMNPTYTLRVLEDPTINRGSQGTGIPALSIARRLVMVHHFARSVGIIGMLRAKKPAIVPFNDAIAPVAYEVVLVASEEYFASVIKVETPSIAPNGGAPVYPQAVTLACGTAGASIYYTIDGSYPRAGNPAALLYAAPFNVNAAATVRACAFKAGLIASDVNAAVFS